MYHGCAFVKPLLPGKAISMYSECVFVTLFIQDGKRMRRTVLSTVARPVLTYFST